MKILGSIWRDLLLVMMFGTTLVLFISLPISPTNDNTLGESIFGLFENHLEKKKVKQESDWKKYYGSCPELKEDLKLYGKEIFSREF